MSGERQDSSSRYERRCALHGECEVSQRTDRSTLECETGHEVTRWLIVRIRNGVAKVVGKSHYLTGGGLIPGAFDTTDTEPEGPRCPTHNVPLRTHRKSRGLYCMTCVRSDGQKKRRHRAMEATA